MNTACAVVIPCYNEAKRLDLRAFADFLGQTSEVGFIFVNDGSTDSTLALISRFRDQHPDSVIVVDQQPNTGKAEAVRHGLLRSFDLKIGFVGYWDADLATPLPVIIDFLRLLESRPDIDMVFGSRVKLLGRQVQRHPRRHYLGRIFATVVSEALRMPIYDTQCGAKLFRNNEDLLAALQQPFISRWVFDVEILARLIRSSQGDVERVQSRIYEYPLMRWVDVDGSKVTAKDFIAAAKDVVRIYYRYLRPTKSDNKPG